MTRTAIAFLSILLILSCTEQTTSSSGQYPADVTRDSDGTVSNETLGATPRGSQERLPIQRGNDTFISQNYSPRGTSRAEIDVVDDTSVEITLVDASISAAAEAIIGDVLEKQFVIQDGLNGQITVQSTGPIPKSALLDLFQAALNANGAQLNVDGDIFQIVAGSNGRRTFRTTGADGITDATIVVAPLEHVSAEQMVEILAPLSAEGLSAIPDSDRNLILLSGSAGQLESAIDALNLFDVDVMRGKSIAVVSLEAADPSDVVEELEAIFGAQEGGLLQGVIEFHPNDRLNSVLVITSRSQYMDDAQRWIQQLDRTAGQSQQYTKVYPLQNRQADELAPILDQVLGGGVAGGLSSPPKSLLKQPLLKLP